jgi:hypothetical protein
MQRIHAIARVLYLFIGVIAVVLGFASAAWPTLVPPMVVPVFWRAVFATSMSLTIAVGAPAKEPGAGPSRPAPGEPVASKGHRFGAGQGRRWATVLERRPLGR